LSDRLLSVQETDRAALAHELHDEFGQVLTAVKLQLQAVEQRTPSPRIEDCVALVDQVLQQVRSLSLDLRPAQLDDQGLAVALASHLARLSRQTGRTIGFQCGDDVPRLVGQRATACFRIVQEAITNALRHSGAGEIRVKLERVGHDSHDDCAGASLRMVIRDDGVGFDPEVTRINALTGTSIGILGMQDRVNILGGALDIRSAPGTGTEVRVDIPLASLLQGSG
jgi:signal transduction histidine kinase